MKKKVDLIELEYRLKKLEDEFKEKMKHNANECASFREHQ